MLYFIHQHLLNKFFVELLRSVYELLVFFRFDLGWLYNKVPFLIFSSSKYSQGAPLLLLYYLPEQSITLYITYNNAHEKNNMNHIPLHVTCCNIMDSIHHLKPKTSYYTFNDELMGDAVIILMKQDASFK